MLKFPQPITFDWDEGNIDKNLRKHRVTTEEIEKAFYDEKAVTFPDEVHSRGEIRYRIIGAANNNRHLFIVFTLRNDMVRVISARDLNKKEYPLYEKRT